METLRIGYEQQPSILTVSSLLFVATHLASFHFRSRDCRHAHAIKELCDFNGKQCYFEQTAHTVPSLIYLPDRRCVTIYFSQAKHISQFSS